MKHTAKLLAILFAAIALTACENEKPSPTPLPTNDTQRTIVYTVGDNEEHRTVKGDAEWDALLDKLCDFAQQGEDIAFFSLENYPQQASKESTTITTSNRDELKHWMKEMEKQGRTVRISYDDNTGTWNGTAYATAPSDSTTASIIGTWHFNSMVVTQFDLNGQLVSSDLYAPEDNGGSWHYTFSSNGTLTLTINGMDGTTATDNSTWSLSDDGVLYSDLLPSGTYWNVNWITNTTLIISSADLGTTEGDIYYQLQFDRE